MQRYRTIPTTAAVATTGALLAVLAAAPVAGAHVTVSTDNPTAGGYAIANIKVPHGCDGKATTKLTVKLPDGVTSFAAGRSPFWTSEVKMRTLDEPIEGGHGDKITEVASEVVYTAETPLPDGDLDILPASIRWPDTEGPVYMPIVQDCEGGASSGWIEVPAEGESGDELEMPAPMVELAPAGGHGHDADDAKDDAKHADDEEGDDEVEAAAAVDTSDLEDDVDAATKLGYAGLGAGALGILIGLGAFMRRRK